MKKINFVSYTLNKKVSKLTWQLFICTTPGVTPIAQPLYGTVF